VRYLDWAQANKYVCVFEREVVVMPSGGDAQARFFNPESNSQ